MSKNLDLQESFSSLLQLGLALERGLVLQAVVARKARHVRLARPFLENAADVLTRDAGHRGKVALRDLLTHQDAAATDVLSEAGGKAEQGARDAALQREKSRSRQRIVGVDQAVRQQLHDMLVELGIVAREGVERGAADEAQLGIAQRGDRGRARRSADHRELAHHGARPEHGENALAARRRHHADLEQTVVDAIADVAFVAADEQNLVSRERRGAGLGEQAGEQPARERAEKIGGWRRLRHQGISRKEASGAQCSDAVDVMPLTFSNMVKGETRRDCWSPAGPSHLPCAGWEDRQTLNSFVQSSPSRPLQLRSDVMAVT